MRRTWLIALLALVAAPTLTAQVERSGLSQKQLVEQRRTERQQRLEQRRAQRLAQRQRFAEARNKKMAERQVFNQARSYRRLRVPGDQVRPAVERLAQKLDWHDSLESAQRVAKNTGKPIVWIHALGDLGGVL
ncbi:MAG: hypothetical protein V3U11_09150 [Planctomycetota bacterium]